jgi:glycosyltransferase involved in cell wall biosynthesis
MSRPRVAVVADLAEERWHSMDLVSEILMLGFRAPTDRVVDAERIRPRMTRRLTRLPGLGRLPVLQTADRVINRLWDYRTALQGRVEEFDLFHIVDHSYAHLVTALPPGRSLVMCHDVDAFAGVLPGTTARSVGARLLARPLLAGLRAARMVVCGSYATRAALLASGVVEESRLAVVPYGVHPSCTPASDRRADQIADQLLGAPHPEVPEILHVGSTVARKRIDVLLDVFAALRRRHPAARLVRVYRYPSLNDGRPAQRNRQNLP